MVRRLAALVLALPLAALAQAPAAPPADAPPAVAPPADPVAPPPVVSPAEPVAPAPVAPPPAPPPAPALAAARSGITVEWGGWLQTHAWRTFGGVNPTASGTTDLPLFAADARDAAGVSARQSRIRAVVGLPSDGLLSGASLKGLVELDFMGPLASDDHSLPAARLRHAWVSAAWKEHANLTVLVGQSWGVFTGPHFAASLAHLAVPRFGGAGFLYRRAPQVRVSAESAGPVSVGLQLAALAPYDRPRSAGVLVGERSGQPDVEGRVALRVKPGGKPLLELGASGHRGQQVYLLDGPKVDETITSWGGSADVKLELPYLTVVGAAFAGEALGALASIAPEVRFTAGGTPAANVAVDPVATRGGWVQGILTPVRGLQLVGGYGIEDVNVDDLPFTVPANPDDPAQVAAARAANARVVNRNQQVSGGVLVDLTSRWRVSTEVTWYVTNTQDRFQRNSTQVEVGSLVAF